jgi:hypothetical protein
MKPINVGKTHQRSSYLFPYVPSKLWTLQLASLEKPLKLGIKTSKANESICLDLGLHA